MDDRKNLNSISRLAKNYNFDFKLKMKNMADGILKGKKGIIFGALNDMSIAWKVAERAHEEGAEFVLTNAPVAMRMGAIKDLAAKVNAEIIPADATKTEDLENLIDQSMEILGGKIDFVLHSIGMSPNVRKGKHYTNVNYNFYQQTLDVSATSLHKTLAIAYEKEALNEWASVLGLTYIAAQRVFPDYGDMADAKSLLESIARSFGYHYGLKNKVRVNTISQSPTVTTAGSGIEGFDAFIQFADKMSPLGNASALDCANYCVAMFSDLTRYVTMQNLYHDGGFSNSGITQPVIDMFEKEK